MRHFLLVLAAFISPLADASAAERDVLFNRDVKPILARYCFQCHGPDKKHRAAELRLDQEKGIRRAFEPRKLLRSKAWRRMRSTDSDEMMPPKSVKRRPTASELMTIGKWIEQGAKWEGHWSFNAPRNPALPVVKQPAWVKNPIDAFVLSRLEAEGLNPSPAATRERLIRRVTLDITGLPPTLTEIDAFLADQRPDAYERVVNRLLASPRYGERMTVAWMDMARYGDSSVFHADGRRDMWPWRDWVIRAYNQNMSFRQFTIEQLAGDLLPNATNQQRVATGFHRNNATTDEGGAIAEEFRVEYAVDRVKTTSLVWLGLSLECAQCHDHKYDPITQREYYQVFAYFNQASDPGMQTRRGNQAPVVNVTDPLRSSQLARIRLELRKTLKSLAARRSAKEVQLAYQRWVKQQAQRTPGKAAALPKDTTILVNFEEKKGPVVAARGVKRKARIRAGQPQWRPGKIGGGLRLTGRSWVDFGRQVANFERTERFSFGAWIRPEGKLQGAVLSRMNDRRAFRGYDFLISGGHLEVHLVHQWDRNAIKVRTNMPVVSANRWQHVFATYDGSSKASGIKIYVDGKVQPTQTVVDRLSKTIRANVAFAVGRRRFNPASFRGTIDDVRVYKRTLSLAEVGALSGQDPVGALLRLARRSPAQEKQLLDHYLNQKDKVYAELLKQRRQLEIAQQQNSKPVSTVMVMKDVPNYRMTYVLTRGNYASPDKQQPVRPGTPSILPPPTGSAKQNRLGLARWLTQPNHPLTARVTVNRYWYMLFGNGLVRSLEDFGAQGETPSHPALLDYLAVDFVQSGWNVKHMLKKMVMSATYRQSSRISPELRHRDPDNRLLGRGPRFRMNGEVIRDSALAASQLLILNMGGPSVKPYQPPGLWNEVSLSGGVRFRQDKGAKLYRRSMYTFWKRSAPAPGLTIFDTPSREKCVIRRSQTNTPLQALVVLNDPQFVEAARHLAARAMRSSGALSKQIELMYRWSTGVRPTKRTMRILAAAFASEHAVFKKAPQRAAQLLKTGDSSAVQGLDQAHHAALTIVASIIFNLDATLTRG